MMRELGPASPVVWPAWCYSGEGQSDGDASATATDASGQQATTVPSPTPATPPPKTHGKRRGGGSGAAASGAPPPPATNGADAHNNNNVVKSERLSPAAAPTPDTGSSSSRSATPSSSYPGTPPASAASAAPASPGGGGKHGAATAAEQLVTRNYSDFMRSLAAKYNNANPNDYFSTPARNGFPVALDPRFSPFKQEASPFVSLMPSPVHKASATSAAPKDVAADDAKKAAVAEQLYAGFPAAPIFPPLIDMSSTQALLNMVRTANAHSAAASQLESYLKVSSGGGKRTAAASASEASSPAAAGGSPLDLSATAAPAKRPRGGKASLGVAESLYGDALLHIPVVDALRAAKEAGAGGGGGRRRYGSVSPKPLGARAAAATAGRPRTLPCLSLCTDSQATASWNVDDVCNFIGSIDICAEYAPNFREQRIDGSALPLLTENHLTTTLGMKLGPALKLKATLVRRLGQCAVCQHCVHCHGAAPPAPVQTPPAAALGRPSSTGN